MICLYTHTTSPRLQYICQFIFGELMGIEHEISIDSEYCRQRTIPVINYSSNTIENSFSLSNHSLLFEQDIKPQDIDCFTANDQPAFFKTGGDFPFDILAASFFLISRYEEYLPHEKDEYGRYAHKGSLAFRQNFLHIPLVNIWVQHFTETLQKKYPAFKPSYPSFRFLPTYDIDVAFSYRHKGWIRNLGGFIKSPSPERWKVLLGSRPDPFDSYAFLDELHRQHDLHPSYFFLVAERNGVYDKNILPHKDIMWKLVKGHARKYTIGLHPSWQSGDNPSFLHREKVALEAMGEMQVTRSRQHYIRLTLPETYRGLITEGIEEEYSMGYGSINGFRASVATPFYWYDLEKEEQTALRIYPFCFMDANAYYEQHYSPVQALEESLHYLQVCRKVNGTLITLWHNNFLGTDPAFAGWRQAYEQFIAQVRQ